MSTALTVREEQLYPVLRWGRSQFSIKKDVCIVQPKESLKITYDDFISFMGTTNSPSRSPDRWKQFLTPLNYGMLKSIEGRYPFAMFDVEGHPSSKEFIFLIPQDVATKLLPILYKSIKDDPDAHGVRVNTSKTSESKEKHRLRLENLQWSPSDCVSSQNKSGVEKACQPNPLSNGWSVLPAASWVHWFVKTEKKKTEPASTKRTGKRKAEPSDVFELPLGGAVKKNIGISSIREIYSIPAKKFVTNHRNGFLDVIVYEDGAYGDAEEVQEVDEAEDAGDAQEAGEAGEAEDADEAGEAADDDE